MVMLRRPDPGVTGGRFVNTLMPRASDAEVIGHLIDLYDSASSVESIGDSIAIDTSSARYFHVGGGRATDAQLLGWRRDLIGWATETFGYPGTLHGADRRSEWIVALGEQLRDDTEGMPEAGHPEVYSWLASYLFPDLVVWRWGWPRGDGPDPPVGAAKWRRFTTHQRNALRLAWWRVALLGADIARSAIEDEFQAVLERPAFGNDPRVAAAVLATLIDEAESARGASLGRGKLAQLVGKELRADNALRPLRLVPSRDIVTRTQAVIERVLAAHSAA